MLFTLMGKLIVCVLCLIVPNKHRLYYKLQIHRLSLAEAHARLSLRSCVSRDDALSAIQLYEECVTSLKHHSVLNMDHEPHWRSAVTEYYLTQQVSRSYHTLLCIKHRSYKLKLVIKVCVTNS